MDTSIPMGFMRNETYMTVIFCKVLFRADYDGSSHSVPKVLVYVL